MTPGIVPAITEPVSAPTAADVLRSQRQFNISHAERIRAIKESVRRPAQSHLLPYLPTYPN